MKQLAGVHEVKQQLTQQQKRIMECATEKGPSAWVTTVPIDDHCFLLHKASAMIGQYLDYLTVLLRLSVLC